MNIQLYCKEPVFNGSQTNYRQVTMLAVPNKGDWIYLRQTKPLAN